MKYDFVLSGRITGNPDYKVDFARAVVRIRWRHPGAQVWNPALLEPGREYRWYMERCVEVILYGSKPACVLVLLPGWNRGLGSVAEWALARCLGWRCLGIAEV